MASNIHFWIIFVNARPGVWGWSAHATSRGGLDIKAYRTKKEAASDIYAAQQNYGKRGVRLYKFKPEAFIMGACK